MADFETLLTGLCFPEGPRWHDGRLWFSDMHALHVMTVDLAGKTEIITPVPNHPSGLGWLPNGDLLIVSMDDRKLLKWSNGTLAPYADLSSLATWHCNDMIVDANGRAYVGNFGSDIFTDNPTPLPANLIRVDTDGSVHLAAPDMQFPNGAVITPDAKQLIIAESWGGHLSAFSIHEDGTLSDRRVWAKLDNAMPDGICLDEAGGAWVASPVSAECLRVEDGGKVTHRLKVDTQAFACMLGGPDGKTLFACTSASSSPEEAREQKSGKIEFASAPYGRAGLP